jgi:outer membrane protein assembly factor BamB
VWESNKVAPGNASPVLDGNRLYVLNKAGVMTCADAKTGDILWQTRLKGTFWATPVIAGGYAYCANQDGDCLIFKLGDKGELVHTAAFGEPFFGTPAAAGGALYLRSEKTLWKMAENK